MQPESRRESSRWSSLRSSVRSPTVREGMSAKVALPHGRASDTIVKGEDERR